MKPNQLRAGVQTLFPLILVTVLSGCSSPPGLSCGAGTHADSGLCLPDVVDVEPTNAPDAGRAQLEAELACSHLLGGPSAVTDVALGISRSHAAVRHFGPTGDYPTVDAILASALDGTDRLSEKGLVAYSSRLEGVCALLADDRPLPQASVQLSGDVAVIHPGAGEVLVPAEAKAIAIDLRGLPNTPALEAALVNAAGAALQAAQPRARKFVREYYGYACEYNDKNLYANRMVELPSTSLPGRAAFQLPLAIITEEAMAPASAQLAGELRLSNAAWLWGAGLLAASAESQWQPVGKAGIAYRAMNLEDGLGRWPDLVPPDVDEAGIQGALLQLSTRATPPLVHRGPANRPELKAINPLAGNAINGLTLGSARAAQITAHGVLRRFFPYFHVVGDQIDDRLRETLAALDATPKLTRKLHYNLMSRLGEALHDGHNFITDVSGESSVVGLLPVALTEIAGQPVVTASLTTAIKPGDTLVTIGGRSIADWYAEELPRTAGATPGYKFDLANRKLLELEGPTAVGLRAPDNTQRTVTVAPISYQQYLPLYTTNKRNAGWLTDLGAPNIYYLDLSVAADVSDGCARTLTEAGKGTGLIVDMRGYPEAGAFACMGRLAQSRMMSPIFRIPLLTGPNLSTIQDDGRWFIDPVAGSTYAGPVVLLVGPVTVSAAETVSAMLVDAGRVKKVVGRPSAGTNGNITYMRLPGGLYFSFTGMEVLRGDRSPVHGAGIVPDVLVLPTAADQESGADRTLEAAVTAVQAP